MKLLDYMFDDESNHSHNYLYSFSFLKMIVTIQKTIPSVTYSVNKVEFEVNSWDDFNKTFPLAKQVMARIDRFEEDIIEQVESAWNPQIIEENKELSKLVNNLQIESSQKTVMIDYMKRELGDNAEIVIDKAKSSTEMARTTLHSDIED